MRRARWRVRCCARLAPGESAPSAVSVTVSRSQPKILVGDDPELLGRCKRKQPRHRLLDHGLFAIEREQLLGALSPAERPEAGAAAAGQNHGIEIGVFSHGFSQISTDSSTEPESETTFAFPAQAVAFRARRPAGIPAPTAGALRNCLRTPEPRPRRPWPA